MLPGVPGHSGEIVNHSSPCSIVLKGGRKGHFVLPASVTMHSTLNKSRTEGHNCIRIILEIMYHQSPFSIYGEYINGLTVANETLMQFGTYFSLNEGHSCQPLKGNFFEHHSKVLFCQIMKSKRSRN